MSEISLMHLIHEEYGYELKNQDVIVEEFLSLYEAIMIHENNIIYLETAKELKKKKNITGGTGPLPTNSKKPLNIDDFDGGHDAEIEVDFEDKIGNEKKGIWNALAKLLRTIKDWVTSIIFKIIQVIRKDTQKLNDANIRAKIKHNIVRNKSVKTYPFTKPPQELVSQLFTDIIAISNSITPREIITISSNADLPFANTQLLGVKLAQSDNDLTGILEQKILNGLLGSRGVQSANITYESLIYFITEAPPRLRDIQSLWHRAEKAFPKFEVIEPTLKYSRQAIFQAQSAVNAVLSLISKLIFNVSSCITILSK